MMMAAIVVVLEERGINPTGLSFGLLKYLRAISDGVMTAPEAASLMKLPPKRTFKPSAHQTTKSGGKRFVANIIPRAGAHLVGQLEVTLSGFKTREESEDFSLRDNVREFIEFLLPPEYRVKELISPE